MIRALVLFYVLLYCTFLHAQPEQSLSLTERIALLSDSVIKYAMTTQHIPGVAISVVHDGELIFSKGYGNANEAKGITVDPASTRLSVASISKTFTYTALMQLIEEGRLNMDDEVSEILDLDNNAQEFGSLKVRHLFTHTAGFEDGYVGHWMANAISDNLSLLDYIKSNAPKRIRKSDEFIVYSNYASALAGAVIEKVTGQPFKRYMLNNILLPLGMHHSTFEQPPFAEDEGITRAVGHHWTGSSYDTYDDEYVSNGMTPAAGLLTTADDIAKFMIAHLEEDKDDILFAKTKKRMHRPLFTNHPFLSQNAHGFWTSPPGSYETLSHTGSVSGTLSHMVLLPRLNFGIFISANTNNSLDLILRFVDTNLSILFPTESDTIKPFNDTDLEQYNGDYLSLQRNFSTFERAFTFPVTVSSSNQFLLVGFYGETHRWIPIGKHQFIDQLTGERLVFQPKEEGGFWLLRGNTVFEPIGMVDNTLSFLNLLYVLAIMSVIILVIALNRQVYSVETVKGTAYVTASFVLLACSFLLSLAMVVLTMNIQGPDFDALMAEGAPVTFHILQVLLIVNMLVSIISAYMLFRKWTLLNWHMASKLFHSTFLAICISCLLWATYLRLLTPLLAFS